MRYEIPQFIDVEDKLFGPLTFKQFIYLLGGGALCYLFYNFLPFSIALFFIIPVGLLSAALAFYKHNTRPFIEVLQNFVSYVFKPKSFLWKRVNNQQKVSSISRPELPATVLYEPVNIDRRISDVSKNLDLLDRDQF
jgi:ABC-type nitrate/sulfonate/bicarbonate transport system permease component